MTRFVSPFDLHPKDAVLPGQPYYSYFANA
jgi:hypothetical protein